MPKGRNQKLKLLYLYKILSEQTDDIVSLNASQLCDELEKYGVSAERKSIYDDIEALRLYGLDIGLRPEKGAGYYLGERPFQTSELKMLIDIVQSARFISEKKSAELIEKIRAMAPVSEKRSLMRQVVLANRVKSANESVYYSVDCLYRAMDEKRKVRFRYFTWDVRKNKLYKNKGQFYCVDPLSLMWADETYYLAAYDPFAKMVKHYRVDKMENTSVCDEPISHEAETLDFNAAEHAAKSFHMFGGAEREVTLRGSRDATGILFDRFGKDVFLIPQEDGSFRVSVKVTVSPAFYSWIFGLCGLLTIEGPEDVVNDYRAMCKKAQKECGKDK